MKKNEAENFAPDHFGLPVVSNGSGGGKADTEELELVLATALNQSREDLSAKLSQKYYTKHQVMEILKDYEMTVLQHKFVTDSIAEAVADINTAIEDKELTVAAAINNLNERITNLEN